MQDAVALALTFDRKAASAVAARAEDDEALQRKLWLAIARHLIDAASDSSDPAADPVRGLWAMLNEAECPTRRVHCSCCCCSIHLCDPESFV